MCAPKTQGWETAKRATFPRESDLFQSERWRRPTYKQGGDSGPTGEEICLTVSVHIVETENMPLI